MATIYDVAARCGVSASTVSYVLSGQGDRRRIAPATQARVRAAAAATLAGRSGKEINRPPILLAPLAPIPLQPPPEEEAEERNEEEQRVLHGEEKTGEVLSGRYSFLFSYLFFTLARP